MQGSQSVSQRYDIVVMIKAGRGRHTPSDRNAFAPQKQSCRDNIIDLKWHGHTFKRRITILTQVYIAVPAPFCASSAIAQTDKVLSTGGSNCWLGCHSQCQQDTPARPALGGHHRGKGRAEGLGSHVASCAPAQAITHHACCLCMRFSGWLATADSACDSCWPCLHVSEGLYFIECCVLD